MPGGKRGPAFKTLYRCWFRFNDVELSRHASPLRHAEDDRGPSVFKDGFWVDKDLNYDQWAASAAHYWIPPHAILYIEKIGAP